MGYKDLLSYSSTMVTPCSLPINEDTRLKFLNLGFNIKENILRALFSLSFFKKERKDFNTTQTSIPMLDAKEVNSSTTIDSSSIKFCEEGITSSAFYSFKTMDIAEFRASLSNQCPQDWLKTCNKRCPGFE